NYAADVKYTTDLFWPHHLLHNAFHSVVYQFVSIFAQVDAMNLMNFVTAIFAIATLLVVWRILARLTSKQTAQSLTLFAGACYGFMRYSVQCETYIIPIFFSVCASYFFIRIIDEKKIWLTILMGIMSVLACLFHQVQIFWTVVIFFALILNRQYLNSIIYFAVLMLIFAVYAVVLVFYNNTDLTLSSLVEFGLTHYISNGTQSGFGFKSLVMIPISFFRSFMQVHGNFVLLLKIFPWLYAVFVIMPIMGYAFFKTCRKSRKTNANKQFAYTHLCVFVLQFAFAAFSDGNTEFMVMLPIALIFGLSGLVELPWKHVIAMALSMFVWNFSWSILPESRCNYYNSGEIVEHIRRNPEAKYILSDEPLIENLYFYRYGELIEERVFSPTSEIPDGEYFSDIIDRPSPMSRSKYLHAYSTENYTSIEKEMEISADFGSYNLYSVQYSR
ncbi:MAG: glycosyltransferase family 39 protein, partial [Bacteroidales bacterium]|nr:glycosyltransferase family 39 protein [Bacteroidales bacterium]